MAKVVNMKKSVKAESKKDHADYEAEEVAQMGKGLTEFVMKLKKMYEKAEANEPKEPRSIDDLKKIKNKKYGAK